MGKELPEDSVVIDAYKDRFRGPPRSSDLKSGGSDGISDGMEARFVSIEKSLAKMEGALSSLQISVNVAVALSAVLVPAFLYLVANQMSFADKINGVETRLTEKVNALPDQINRNLLELNRTLSEAIIGAKATQPQTVIIQPVVPQQSPAPAP